MSLFRFLRRLVLLALAAAFVWFGGFLWFITTTNALQPDETIKTDAIVVLTGGPARIATGVDLLERELAQKLFITGLNEGSSFLTQQRLRQLSSRFECCIVLEYDAPDTVGNAAAAAEWMRKEGFHSLRAVTSTFHMPRSMVELRRFMPEMEIVPHPVFTSRIWESPWSDAYGMKVTALEFTKFVIASLRAWVA